MSVVKQKGAPTRTTAGKIGDIRIDTITGKKYECTFAYVDSNGVGDYTWRCAGVAENVEPEKVEQPTQPEKVESVEPKIEEEQKEETPVPNRQMKHTTYTRYGKAGDNHGHDGGNAV